MASKKNSVKKQVYSILLFFICFSAFSQSVNSSLNKVNANVQRGEYYLAIENYLNALKEDSLNKKANLEFGLLNTQYVNNPGIAGVYLIRAERASTKDTLPELLLGLAQHYQSVKQYEKAISYYKRLYSKLEGKPESDDIEKTITKSITACEYALSNPVNPAFKRIKAVNAGSTVNTVYPEYFPVLTNKESVLFFTARRRDNVGHKIDDFDGNYFEDMFIARKGKDNTFNDAHPFSSNDKEVNGLSNTKEHEAVVSLSTKGDKFFTFLNDKLYESTWQGSAWTAPKEMNSSINPLGAYQSYLSTSSDGKVIYFSSERPEGLGKLDIYKSEMQADGNWGPAINLGPTINTKEDDDSPFISQDGKTLYFASKGHPGYGEYDLFKSVLDGSNWGLPQNMGTVFNSSGDDVHLSFNADETSGVYSSAKAGGYGDMDIYTLRLKAPFEDFTTDALASINLPDTVYVNEVTSFGVFSSKLPPSAFKEYYWQVADSILKTQGEVASYTFTKLGTCRVRTEAITNENDVLGFEKNVFVTNRTVPVVTNTTVVSTVSSLESIYFNFDNSGITAEAKEVLKRNLAYLESNPGTTLAISAFCDSQGPADYNLILSKRRAQSALNYLKKMGLAPERIKEVAWFGEKDPLNKCADGTPCTISEYKINRRVEFKVEKN